MTINIPGYTTLTGNPVTILEVLQEARIFEKTAGDEYINSVVQMASRLYGITLEVKGTTYADRAESLLREMAKHRMIELTD